MRIGVPAEIKVHEYRVGLTPGSVAELTAAGHEVLVQTRAGAGIGFMDRDYQRAGATIAPDAATVFRSADLIVKVKEPQPAEYPMLRSGQILFTYLHLAADRELTDALIDAKTTAIAYETVQLANRALPLLAPMSEVAGRLAPIVGANAMLKPNGGPGLLVPGVPGTYPAKIVVLGGGVAGTNAVSVAALISIFAALNGSILSGSRVPYAAAREGYFFRAIANVHPVHRTPGTSAPALRCARNSDRSDVLACDDT